jgi:predicted nucleotidyltransferase
MTRDEVVSVLRQHAAALNDIGAVSASLFGSVARGESDPHDVDIAVRLDERFSAGGFDYFWQREQLRENLSKLLGSRVDVVEEPVRKPGLQQEINRDRTLVFSQACASFPRYYRELRSYCPIHGTHGRSGFRRKRSGRRCSRALSGTVSEAVAKLGDQQLYSCLGNCAERSPVSFE